VLAEFVSHIAHNLAIVSKPSIRHSGLRLVHMLGRANLYPTPPPRELQGQKNINNLYP
jgi:hypothetical protein